MLRTFREIFSEKGISPSYTRTRIYHYLEDSKNHPTVDEIYKALKEELPTLSKTTVYNVLNLFVEKELVKLVNMNSSETRYELYEEEHSHFKCDICGIIYDIPIINTHYNQESLGNFKVNSVEVNLSGICPKCM